MQENEKHFHAFEAYYASRNIVKVAEELSVSRASLHKWKREFHWKERCEERDNEIKEQVQAVMMPQWAATKVLLINAFISQIITATKAGIAAENSKDMVAVSKELRALLGEADRHEIISAVKHEITDDPDILKSANALAEKLSKRT